MTLSSQDKEKIKRVVPKASNKIIDAAVARIYVNHPDPEQWNWTGLAGAIVLVDDLLGHTFFLKLIDIIGNQGVLWDQELWVDFQYSQDRVFFHSFEIEDYSIGILFDDKSDAQHFFKRVQNRAKHASKLTVQNNNAVEARKKPDQVSSNGYRGEESTINNEQRVRRAKGILYYDNEPPPEWRSFYKELENMGITEDMIAENREFIKDYISKQGGPLVGLEPPIPRRFQNASTLNRNKSVMGRSRSATVSSTTSSDTRKKKAPPPPPPPASPPPYQDDEYSSYTQNDSYEEASESATSVASSARKVPPALSTETNRRIHNVPPPMAFPNQQFSSPSPTPTQNTPPVGLPPRAVPTPPANGRPLPNLPVRNVPPPPPSRGNVPPPPPARGNVPPPPPGRSNTSVPAPPRPRRGPAPPPPPSRHNVSPPMQQHAQPPVLPPGHPGYDIPPAQQVQQLPPRDVPLPPPTQQTAYIPQPPPIQQQPQTASIPTPPPPPPTTNMPTFTNPTPPPPPPPTTNMPTFTNPTSPPPPPPPPPPPAGMPTFDNSPPLVEATGDAGRDALLASIRGAGIGSLKKVDKTQLDKPSVLLQEARGEPVSTPSAQPTGGPPGQPASLADALAAALSNRKAKVAASDDESDGDW